MQFSLKAGQGGGFSDSVRELCRKAIVQWAQAGAQLCDAIAEHGESVERRWHQLDRVPEFLQFALVPSEQSTDKEVNGERADQAQHQYHPGIGDMSGSAPEPTDYSADQQVVGETGEDGIYEGLPPAEDRGDYHSRQQGPRDQCFQRGRESKAIEQSVET